MGSSREMESVIIKFNPQVREDNVEYTKLGNIISVNGDPIDLDTIPNGATVLNEATDTDFIQEIEKDGAGNITINLLWAYSIPSDINDWPADLIDPVDGVIQPIASTL